MIHEIEIDGGYAQIIYDASFMPPVIHQIFVPPDKRNQGIGTRLLEAAVAFAERHGDEVLLSPVPDREGPSREVLEAWYGRHGFTWQANRNMMRRDLCVGTAPEQGRVVQGPVRTQGDVDPGT